ncbi:YadA stalk domain-containing protein (plasmid) [Candidatus Trichorickettsia mobilis]|uniref:YadA stalk domain-containing protein n=1 Tax=Candidatus Trichorickettsia mobilis TaxID=1346319 RepID=A0ABZ0UUP2_9RICK|nr:hypothetical protein [Candidatus Trichorickettsia mobilis]WPY01521.1 YadA stalk domain-containing protein [Candidatus Trichorickettsia mobilis]
MPLFLKSIDPTLDIFGNEQSLRFNADQLNNEANLILQNLFTPLVGTNLNTGLAFVNSSLNGFRFKHEFSTSSTTFGNFYLECASRFGGNSSNIFKYDEQTDKLLFFKNVSIPGLGISGNLDLQSNKIVNLADPVFDQDGATKFFVDNHTWSASQISDFDNRVRTNTLDQMSIPQSNLNINAKRIINLASGILSTDAINKSQMDSADTITLNSAKNYTDSKISTTVLNPTQTVDAGSTKTGLSIALTTKFSTNSSIHDNFRRPFFDLKASIDDITDYTGDSGYNYHSGEGYIVNSMTNALTNIGCYTKYEPKQDYTYYDEASHSNVTVPEIEEKISFGRKVGSTFTDYMAFYPASSYIEVFYPIFGVDPYTSSELTTKRYVDNKNITLTGAITGSGTSSIATTLTSRLDQIAAPASNVSMNGYRMTSLGTPINNQDAVTKAYVDNNSGGAGTKSILHGYNAATYSTNVAVGDHIKFDSNVFVRGSNISLDTATAYNTSTNTASIGRITLAAGKTYKLTGSINNATSSGSGDYNALRWYNSDTNAALGVVSGAAPPNSTVNRVPGAGTIAYISPSVSTRVELRITFNALSSVNGTGDAIGPAWFTVEEI